MRASWAATFLGSSPAPMTLRMSRSVRMPSTRLLEDDHRADALGVHEAGHVGDVVVRADGDDLLGHDLRDLHEAVLFQRREGRAGPPSAPRPLS